MSLLGAAEIRELAAALDLKPSKSLGQNFVHDANVCRKIVRTAGVTSSDIALEIGPGLGAITRTLLEKGAKIAAHKLEAAVEDLDFSEGKWTVKGTDKSIGFGDVALTAYVPHNYPQGVEPGLDFSSFYDPANFTYPFGTHIAIVEVDPQTGKVDLKRFIAVDDVGNVINPMIVEGQIHGGLAQGIGQAMFEGALYDDAGNLINGSFMDYTMPRADDLPMFEVDRLVTPCPHNPLGVKGAGEAGAIGSTPAVVNAVMDALSPLGIFNPSMPMTPESIPRTRWVHATR